MTREEWLKLEAGDLVREEGSSQIYLVNGGLKHYYSDGYIKISPIGNVYNFRLFDGLPNGEYERWEKIGEIYDEEDLW